jgi:manganese transport protein
MVYTEAAKYVAGNSNILVDIVIILAGLGFITLLVITVVYPLISRYQQKASSEIHKTAELALGDLKVPVYNRIAMALDFSIDDEKVISNALAHGNPQTEYLLIHIIESASAKYLGVQADDFETRKDQEQMDKYITLLHSRNIRAKGLLGYRHRAKEIVRLVKEEQADFLVLGGHGHTGIKDWIYGETANQVRHQVRIPVLIIQ